MKSPTVKLVTFGRGGDTCYCGKGSTISGYGSPDRPHAGDATRHDIPDGTPALDLHPALESDEGIRWAICGPMVNVDLADDEIDRCPDPSEIFASAMVEASRDGNPYAGMLATHQVTKRRQRAGSLDSVSRSEYIAGWLERGARLGRYEGGRIVWS